MLSKELKDVLKIQRKTLEIETELKNKLYQQIISKIQTHAKQCITFCVYTVPRFVYGFPPFNVDEIQEYLLKRLTNDGFVAELMNNDCIYISWNIKDIGRAQCRK